MIDTAKIKVAAGNGGDGLVSFRRERNVAKGGPWGGDGGSGGNIIFEVSLGLNTLTPFARKRHYKAQNGQHGMKNRMKGHDGDDLLVKVPAGTIIKDELGNILHDLTELDQKVVIAKGGQGGLGNWHFKSSVNRTPLQATDGKPGQEFTLYLELKLIADIGLIGLPSSGKSTLLNALTKANAKTAEYHFTTLEPNLGVLDTERFVSQSDKTFVLADIPGLIEGAAEGKGLGHDFLRHIERTKILVHIIDGIDSVANSPSKLIENYKIIQTELKTWNTKLPEKHQIVVVNKIDITEVAEKKEAIKKEFKKQKVEIIFVSAATLTNLDTLVAKILKLHNDFTEREKDMDSPQKPALKYTIDNLPNKRIVFRR